MIRVLGTPAGRSHPAAAVFSGPTRATEGTRIGSGGGDTLSSTQLQEDTHIWKSDTLPNPDLYWDIPG